MIQLGINYRVLESLSDCCLIFNSNNEVEWMNPVARDRVLGKMNIELPADIGKLFDISDSHLGDATAHCHSSGESSANLQLRFAGHQDWMNCTMTLIPGEETRYLIVIPQKVLKQNEERLLDIAMASGEFMWETDPNWKFSFVGGKVDEILGYEADELIGTSVFEIMEEDQKQNVWAQLTDNNDGFVPFRGLNFKATTKNGDQVWLRASGKPIYNNEQFTGFRGVILDVTREYTAELALQRSRKNYQLLFEQTPAGVIFYGTDLIVRDCNEKITDILQVNRQNLLGLEMRSLKDQRILPCLESAVTGENGFYKGSYVTTNSNVTLHIQMHTVPFYDAEGNVSGGICMVEDTTEKQRIADNLKWQSKVEKTILDLSTRFISVDHEEINELVNESLDRICGLFSADRSYIFKYDPESDRALYAFEWCADGIEPMIDKAAEINRSDAPRALEALITKGKTFSVDNVDSLQEISKPDYELFKYQGIQSVIILPMIISGDVSGFIGLDMVRKTREWKESDHLVLQQLANIFASAFYRLETEFELRKREERFRSLVHNAHDLITIISSRGRVLYNSPSFYRITGYKDSEVIEKNIRSIFHPEDLDEIIEMFQEVRSTSQSSRKIVLRIYDSEGRIRWMQCAITNLLDNPAVKGIVINSRDITETREQENVIRKNEQMLNSINTNVSEGIFRSNADGHIVYANNAFLNLFGFESVQEASERHATGYYENPEDRERIVYLLEKYGSISNEQVRFRRKDSSVFWGLENTTLIRNEDGTHYYDGVINDITARVENESAQRALYRVSQAAQTTKSASELCAVVHKEIKGIIPVENFCLSLFDQESGYFSYPYFSDTELESPSTHKDKSGLTEFVFHSDGIVSKNKSDLEKDIQSGNLVVEGEIPEKLLGAPLFFNDRKIGVLLTYSRKNDSLFEEKHHELLTFVADQIALAVSNLATLELLDMQHKYSDAIINSLPGIYYLHDEHFSIDRWNQNLEQVTGYSRDEIRGMKPHQFFGRDFSEVISDISKSAFKNGGFELELPLQRKNGKNSPYFLSGTVITYHKKNYLSVVGIDIGERVKAEKQTIESLKEKKILLAEIHHRVKNNLAIITGLLSLQADNISDASYKKLIQESELRVRTMAMIHEKLYQNETYSRVEFETYVHELIANINLMYSKPGPINIETNIRSVKLDINRAIPCGLILNELLTNSFKHAFNNKDSGNIKIQMSARNQSVELVYCDDGVGFPQGFNIEHASSLGMTLIQGLTGQLSGDCSFKKGPGLQFNLTFKT